LNLSYVGPIFFGEDSSGSKRQGSVDSSFVYDTGSGFVTVNGGMCFTCSSQYYNPQESKTAHQVQVFNSRKVLSYGSVTLFGQEYSDTVSLEKSLTSHT
jgi:hypothetical protein